MLKIGVLGAGHLGKIHLRCLKMLENQYEIIGFYDVDPTIAAAVSDEFGIPHFPSAQALIDLAEVVDIVTPTLTHFSLACTAVNAGKHVFIEKPLTHTLEEARTLTQLVLSKGVKAQVGHVERFNPALLALQSMTLSPMFIEGHRLAGFNPRGTDVSVVLDLMIHDLDIVLSLVDSEPILVSASGVAVVSDTPDIANARIEFANGCVANLTASRISVKQMRKVRLFQKDAYISLDFLEKNAQIIRLYDEQEAVDLPDSETVLEISTGKGKRFLHLSAPEIEPVNSIKMELDSFADCIKTNTHPKVGIEDGYKALELAYRILHEIDKRQVAG